MFVNMISIFAMMVVEVMNVALRMIYRLENVTLLYLFFISETYIFVRDISYGNYQILTKYYTLNIEKEIFLGKQIFK